MNLQLTGIDSHTGEIWLGSAEYKSQRLNRIVGVIFWAGVTVESSKFLDRINHLKRELPPDMNKFLMFEPLLSDVPKLDLEGIHWVIVGGETNSKGKFRPMEESWVINIRDQVKATGIPFLFKHWPGKSHNSREALLEGRKWEEYPESVMVNMDWT